MTGHDPEIEELRDKAHCAVVQSGRRFERKDRSADEP